MIKAVVPKLVIGLRSFVINPQQQDLTLFNCVLAWKELIPRVHFVSLLMGEFFPRWLRILVNWLSISPDFSEVSQWYVGWKSIFPADLLEDPDVIQSFNTALDLMNMVLTADNDKVRRNILCVSKNQVDFYSKLNTSLLRITDNEQTLANISLP